MPGAALGRMLTRSEAALLVRALRADAQFEDRFRTTLEQLLGAYGSGGWLHRIFNDRGRLIGGLIALYLHCVPEPSNGLGLTSKRFQDQCRQTGICSHGRAVVLLSLMRIAGLLESGAATSDRRMRLLL